jgi:hypothetical protein
VSANDELWGNFAVDDHLRQRAFVPEKVLFDRLVVPQPPPDDEEQYREWTQALWHPERLKQTLAPLEDLAITVPWDKPLRAEWQTQHSSLKPSDRAALRMNLARGALTACFDNTCRKEPTSAATLNQNWTRWPCV